MAPLRARGAWVRRRHMNTTYRRSGGLAALLAAAAIGLAACSGSSSPSRAREPAPHRRQLADEHEPGDQQRSPAAESTTTTTLQNGDPTRLLDEWADCMRSHGDPGQADPTIDANKDIDIDWNPTITGGIFGTNKGGQGNSGPGQYCRAYLDAAQKALGGDHQPSGADQATLEKFSECMRANGSRTFPTPLTAPCPSTSGPAAT